MNLRGKDSILGSYEFSVDWSPSSPYFTRMSFILVWERIQETVERSICKWRSRHYKTEGR
jgi:hypothetical protein